MPGGGAQGRRPAHRRRAAAGAGDRHRQGRDAAWVLDIGSNRYSIEGDHRTGSLPAGLDIELVAAEEEMQSDSVGAIRFYPDGSSTGGRVILKRGDGGYQVGVNWLTGRILIAAGRRGRRLRVKGGSAALDVCLR
jgi:hypothetical protein